MRRTAILLLASISLWGCAGPSKTASSVYDAGRAAASLTGSSDTTASARTQGRPVSARPKPLAAAGPEVETPPMPETPWSARSGLVFIWGDEVDFSNAWRYLGDIERQGPTVKRESSEPVAVASATSGVISGGFWFKVGGGLALVGAAVLLWFGMAKLAGGLAVAGAVSVGIGIFLDKAAEVPYGWYLAGGAAFLCVVFVILWRRYRAWFLDLASVIKLKGSQDIARANADILSASEKAQQKAVLTKNGVLLPTTKEA